MQGPLGTRQGLGLYLLAALVFGAALAWLLAAATGSGLGAALLFAIPLAVLYAVAAGYSVWYLCRAHPLGTTPRWRLLAVFAAAALVTAGLWTAAAAVWHDAWQSLSPALADIGWNRTLALTVFGLGVILYWLAAAGSYLGIEAGRARELATRELQAGLAARDAELRMLRTQVDPHFLFNSLNSISALTSIDPVRARDMTLQLAEFFRLTLGFDATSRVPLGAELQLVRRFLAIEQVRFGQRLAFVEEVGDAAKECLLPPLVLQPLVENAIKHGIGQRTEGGTVRLEAQRAGSLLRIRIENQADETHGRTRGAGLGLANVRQRLAAAYGHEASANWSKGEGMFKVELVLPAETGGSD